MDNIHAKRWISAERTFWGALCAFGLIFGWAASVGAQETPKYAENKTKSAAPAIFAIGLAVPLSGDYAALGKTVAASARVAVEDGGGRLVVRDTLGTPAGAIAAIHELASDPAVLAVLGPVGRRESQAAARAAHRAGMPIFSLAGDASINKGSGWVFRLNQSPGEQASGLAEAVREELGEATRVAILFPQSYYGRQAASGFADRFGQLGGQVTALASYPSDASDFRKPLDELMGKVVHIGKGARAGKKRADRHGYLPIRRKPVADFDLLFIPDFHGNIARILAFLPGAGLQNGDGGEGQPVQLLGLSGWQGASMRLSGALAAGAIYRDIFAGDADGGKAQEFELLFEEKTGRLPVNLDAAVFDATWMLAKIIGEIRVDISKKDAHLKDDKLRRRLVHALPRGGKSSAGGTFHGVTGALYFDADGAAIRPTRLYQFDIGGSVAPWR